MKKLPVKLLLIGIGILQISCSTTIARWGGGEYEVKNQTIKYDVRKNIFEDYGWTRPDIESKKIAFVNNEAVINWGGKKYTLKQENAEEMSIADESNSSVGTSAERVSKKDIYYNKSLLKVITVYRQRWVSYTTYQSQSVPVQRSRQVSYSDYNYSTKSYTTRYRTEYYTAYEYRMLPKTDWRWETYTEYDVQIPEYNYYSFDIGDTRMLIYKVTNNTDSTTEYYIQNAAYLLGKDENKLSYVCIDGNGNGIYGDGKDQMMFNSWNPYSKKSSYSKPRISFLDNYWYYLYRFKNDYMLEINCNNGAFNFVYENNAYYKSKKKGRIKFTGIPKGARVFINGKSYKLKNNKKYKIQYGIYNINIPVLGYLDYEASTVINNNNSRTEVRYVQPGKAGKIVIANIFLDDFFVTVTNSDGDETTKMNSRAINASPGKNKVKIYSLGVSFEYEVDVEEGKTVSIDFEEELKKLKANQPAEKPAPAAAPAEESAPPVEDK
jgi:hypothetical protein